MSQERTDLTGEVRMRVPLPLVIPAIALGLIAVATIGFSQVLLNVPKEAATILAMVMAANVLGAFTFLALRPETARASWPELALVTLWPVLAGVGIAVFDVGAEAAHGGTEVAEEAGAGGEGAGGLAMTAEGVAFTESELTLNAGEEVSLEFVNADPASTPHNIAIYEDDSAQNAIFKGDVIDGGAEITYEFTAPPAGEYYFQCDVHPGMNGTVTVQ